MPAVTNQQMTAEMQRKLTHETTHACLAMLGKWPTWLHEGMAQRLSGETLSPKVKERLLTIAREAKLGSLAKLNAGWGSMDGRSAAVAYGLALVAVDELYSDFGLDGVRNLLRNPERMASTVAELDRRLGL